MEQSRIIHGYLELGSIARNFIEYWEDFCIKNEINFEYEIEEPFQKDITLRFQKEDSSLDYTISIRTIEYLIPLLANEPIHKKINKRFSMQKNT